MTESESELRKRRVSEFRHSVVAELGNPYLPRGELNRLIQAKAQREYVIPYSNRTTLTEGCIRRWLNLYRKYGKAGLIPQTREDQGKSRVIMDAEQSALIHLLETEPKLTAVAAVRILRERGVIQREISSSTLSRFIRSQGLTVSSRIAAKNKEKHLKFEFFSPLECLQVDVMYGPSIPDSNGKPRKALLMAFLDDATRRVVYARFSFSEKSLLFEDGIKHILQAQGLIGRVYTDNGSTFVSTQTQRILDIVGIPLSHSKPGRPQGRGKVERFFRTVRDQFTRPLDLRVIDNIEELNSRFHTWLECEYHRSPHRGLEKRQTPLDAWIAKAHHIRPINPSVDLDRAFRHLVSRRVYKDSTFTLHGTLYEVPPILSGKKIDIYYDPHPPIVQVAVTHAGKDYGMAHVVDSYANSKVKRCYSGSGELEWNQAAEQTPINLRTNSLGGDMK